MLCSLHCRVASIDAAHRSNQAPFFPTHCPLPPREPLALRCLIHWARPAHNLKLQENPKNHPWPSELSAASWHQADFSKSVLWNLTLKKSDKHERQWINNIYVCMCLYKYIYIYIMSKYELRSLTKTPEFTSQSWTVQVTFPLPSAAVADPTACCGGGEGCLKSATHHAWDSDFESNQSVIYCDLLVLSRWWNA